MTEPKPWLRPNQAKRNRVAGLRAYGNAITPQAAEQVIRVFMEWEERAIAKAEGQG